MPKPPIGAIIKTTSYGKIKVLEQLGAGGQGTVYKVDYNGTIKALKWYHDGAFNDYHVNSDGTHKKDSSGNRILDVNATNKAKDEFYENLKNNVRHGSPASQFLWPQDATERVHESFGYIMDLRPKDYYELGTLLLARKKVNGQVIRFESLQAKVDGMINLVNAFQILHNEGYSYQDLNDGNFFFKPKTGEILICDNDNVAHTGYHSGVIGKCRFMAPEVVLQQKMPDTMTDRFSMAVILYYMLFRAHPLEGAISTPACLTPSEERRIYGSDPVFVFDPINKNNRPVRGVADHSVAIWNKTPQYIKDAFIRSFSKDASTFSSNRYLANRLTEMEWIQLLARLRNNIVICSNCKKETIIDGTNNCVNCSCQLPFNRFIQLQKYKVPVRNGAILLKTQLGPCSDKEALDILAKVYVKDGQYGILNCSKEAWQCITTTGAARELPIGSALPAKPGIKVKLAHGSFEIV